MPLTMDLSQDGLHMFFKDYQVQSLRALWSSEKRVKLSTGLGGRWREGYQQGKRHQLLGLCCGERPA